MEIKKIFLLISLAILCSLGFNACCNKSELHFEFYNEAVRTKIMEYALENEKFMKFPATILLEKKVVCDTLIYAIRYDPNISSYFFPIINSFFKYRDVYVGFRDYDSPDVGVSRESFALFIKKNFPDMYDTYVFFKEDIDNEPWPPDILISIDSWILRFVDGILISQESTKGWFFDEY